MNKPPAIPFVEITEEGSTPVAAMPPELAPTYYLDNFRTVLASVSAAYADLLNEEEADFLQRFAALSTDAQALLVRLVMRTRDVYVAGALDYPEIGGVPAALQDLAAAGWVDPDAALSLDELFATATKLQIVAGLADEGLRRSQSKSALREHLAHRAAERLSLGAWLASSSLSAVRLLVRPLMDRFRLLFFGNLYQDWSEFVITDLGHLRYETVSFGREARGFASRQDIDACLRIHVLRGQLEEEGDPAALQACLDDWPDSLSPHVRSRVHKLRFHVGNAAERMGDWPLAESLYLTCEYRGARHRLMRVYEQQGAWDAAFETAQAILVHPASEEEVQATHRALPRLARKLGKPVVKAKPLMSPASDELQLPQRPAVSVEQSVAEALAHPPRVVHYVENALFGSLFGLTFWEVIFKPVPGAFFNPFQAGPADLFHPDFADKRQADIDAALERLEATDYAPWLLERWRQKHGVQNHFVFWEWVNESLLDAALALIPRAHLRAIFLRMLSDLRANRSGFPDLIAFMPAEGRYELIEVKGPGDRVQDNQARWMDYFARHGIPCRVMHARWDDA